MSMFRFIEQLRLKPEHARKRILSITIFFAMLFIIGIWFMRFSLPKDHAALDKSPGPFATLRAPLHNLQIRFDAIRETLRARGQNSL